MSQHAARHDRDQENLRAAEPVRHAAAKLHERPLSSSSRGVLQDVSNVLKPVPGRLSTSATTHAASKRPRSPSMDSEPVQAKQKAESDAEAAEAADAAAEAAADAAAEAAAEAEAEADEEEEELYYSSVEEEALLSTPHYTTVGDFRQPHGMTRAFVRRLQYATTSPEPIFDEFGNDLSEDADPIMCEEYTGDIYAYQYMQQEQYMVDPHRLLAELPASFQWDANRHTLMNWLVSIHRKFRLVGETLYLATNIVDRFMATYRPLKLDEVQLVAASALFIASKYEEVMAPAVTHFAFVASSTADEVREMEKLILITLSFDLGMPQPLNFLRRISKADDYQMNTRTVAKFLLEITLFEPKLMIYRPSDVAAAAMYMSRLILGIHGWPRNFVHYSGGCREEELQQIVAVLREYLRGPCESVDEVFISKYSSKRMMRAASLAIEWARR